MASLERRFVHERPDEPDSDEEPTEDLFAESDQATAERLRPVQDGGCMVGTCPVCHFELVTSVLNTGGLSVMAHRQDRKAS